MRAVDLTLSVGILRVRSRKIYLEHPRIEHWYISRWRVSESQRPRGILIGKTVFGHDENCGWEAISGGRKLQQDRFTIIRSGKSNADAKDNRWRPVHASFTQSCDQLQGSPCLPYSLMTSRLYFVSSTPTTRTPLYTRKSVQTHPRK